jgi:hypothetical protein
MAESLNLRERRVLFSRLLAGLILWVGQQSDHRGAWEIALDEATVRSPRPVWQAGKRVACADAVHKYGSFHHQGLAADLNLYVAGKWISDGGDPAWTVIGTKWESVHKLCTWGGRFRDANHFSLGEGA